jgi:hypothetical protein
MTFTSAPICPVPQHSDSQHAAPYRNLTQRFIMTFIDAHIFFAPLLIKPQLVVARRSMPRRISTQRNGSFVNLLASHAVSQRNFSHLGVASRISTQRNGFFCQFNSARCLDASSRSLPQRFALQRNGIIND